MIMQGAHYPKMEQNPLQSSDLNYGVPAVFNELMDEALDSTNTSELDKLIKDLIEANRPLTETKTPEKPRNASSPEFSTPRYTEAVRQRMTRIALVPVKRTVQFSDDCDIDLRLKGTKSEVF